ncbi:MAG: PLP-dependent aminotransferase family protein [Candidatus Avispirillum sp.]
MNGSAGREPMYIHLYGKFKDEIALGVYPYGAKLPSKRSAAEQNGVSVITVEHAYALLEEEGYIVCRQRSGYFVIYREEQVFRRPPERETEKRKTAATGAPRVFEMENTFPLSVYAKTVRYVLSEYGPAVLERTESAGLPALRDAVARYLGRARGIDVSPDRVVIGSGAEALYHLAVILLGADRRYAIETPSYDKIGKVYASHGIKYEALPLEADGISEEALLGTSADVLHVTPYHSFPSGVTATAAKKQTYLRWARECGAVIIEDDFGSEFCRSRKPIETLFSMDGGERVLYINTFTKSISPAVRIGYMLLPESLAAAAAEKIGFVSCSVPVLEQYVLAQLLDGGSFERHLNRVRRRLRRGPDAK